MTQPHHSTVSRAVFTSAWIEFCRTNGSQEYWRRFGDYLFTDPKRDIPRELLSLPPLTRPRSRRRQRPLRPPDGLHTASEAAAKVRCSVKTLNGYVAAGALKYVTIGHGAKRPRKMFTDADLDEFVTSQTRKDSPCPSDATRARRSGNTISKSEVVAFSEVQRRRRGVKPKP